VGVLASFVRFKVDFAAGSGSLSPAEVGQFTETRSASSASPVGYYSQHLFEMKNYGGSFIARERGMFGIHWINLTGGELDQTWVTADYTAVESAVEAFWSSQAAKISTGCQLVEHRWYGYGAGVVAPNPPSRVQTLATPLAGTGTGAWVRQVASTITLRTALRRHWGRLYVPINSDQFITNGQLSSSFTDAIAAAARTMLMVSPSTQGVVPAVYDRQRHIVFGVTAVEVDSVPDIQRRRRPRDSGYKKIYTS
jgi:hypothetical protein